mgnify:CR=1 FL=1
MKLSDPTNIDSGFFTPNPPDDTYYECQNCFENLNPEDIEDGQCPHCGSEDLYKC